MIKANTKKLGFKFEDTKILLISHADWDHDAGSPTIKKMTGAAYMVMDADVPVIESGGNADFHYGNAPTSLYPPTKVDRVLHDGSEVKLGGAQGPAEVVVARIAETMNRKRALEVTKRLRKHMLTRKITAL